MSDELNINWDAERAAFERWFGATQTKNPVRAHAKSETGTYIDGLTRAAWRAWRFAVMRGLKMALECQGGGSHDHRPPPQIVIEDQDDNTELAAVTMDDSATA